MFLADVGFWQWGAKCVLSARDGSSLAGEPGSVAHKCDEVGCWRALTLRSLTVAVPYWRLYWRGHRNISGLYAQELSLVLTQRLGVCYVCPLKNQSVVPLF